MLIEFFIPVIQPGFDGTNPNRTFSGLHALLPRVGQPRVVGIEPMSCLLDSLEAVMSPLPPWSQSYKLASVDQSKHLLERRAWLSRGLRQSTHAGRDDDASLAKSWLPIKPLCCHTSIAVTTLLSVVRLLERDFFSTCPHVATRIATHVFDYEIWMIIQKIADGGDHCY